MNNKTKKILYYVWTLINIVNIILSNGVMGKLPWILLTIITLFLAITTKFVEQKGDEQ